MRIRDRLNNRNLSVSWKYLKRMIGIIGALFIFCGISNLLNYMYDRGADGTPILWQCYADDANIDNIYLGSSHVYCDINPMQLDDINGKYNFNMASSAQPLNASYYLLKEADKDNLLSHVYLELFYVCSTKDNADLDPIDVYYYKNWDNIDYMRFSYNKICYMLSISGTEKYIDTLLPFSRYRLHLNDWDYIKETVERKGDKYLFVKQYQTYDDEYGEYTNGNGLYHYSTIEFVDQLRRCGQDRILGKNPMGEKSEKYLRKIIAYCQEQDIPITLFISPIDELQLISTEHYDNYINQIKEISDEYSVPFYDFNLTKKEYLPIHYGEYFMDIGHLNHAGASMFTPFFSEVVSRDMDENEKYFYTSYAEKLQSEDPAIYGFYYRESEVAEESTEQEETLICKIASNREQGMEYKIVLTINEEEGESRQQIIQDFSENKEFTIFADEHGICTIIARMKDNPEEVQTLKVSY